MISLFLQVTVSLLVHATTAPDDATSNKKAKTGN